MWFAFDCSEGLATKAAEPQFMDSLFETQQSVALCGKKMGIVATSRFRSQVPKSKCFPLKKQFGTHVVFSDRK